MAVIKFSYNSLLRFFIAIIMLSYSSTSIAQLPCGQTIDLNTWTVEGSPNNGVWVVGAGGNSVQQTFNSAATWFVSPNDFIDVLIQGSIQVNTASDDDLVGFVFGYQEPFGALVNPNSTPLKTFVFDWKQGTQNAYGMNCSEGFALYEIDGLFNFNGTVGNPGALLYPEFWERINTPIVNVLDTDYANNGWNDFQQYDFQLKYTSDSIVIWIDGVAIFEESGCFEPGRFGFYNQSQNAVTYSNFSYNIEYDFDASDTLICLGDTSFFEIGAGCNNVIPPTTSFVWDFDDGNTDAGIDPFHIYTTPGIYQAQLVSSDPFGCADTSIQIIEVLDYPIPDAGLDETSCDLTYVLNAAPSTGQWSALNGGFFSDASLSNSEVTVPSIGVYSFVWEATNAAGCSAMDTVTVAFSNLSINATLTSPTCNGGGNGDISLVTSGGALPITYQWDASAANQTSSIATNLGSGTFGVIVSDNLGCFIDTSFVIVDPQPFSFTLDLLSSDCDIDDGSATVNGLTGGTVPYSFDWGGGVVPDNFSIGLGSGTYSVTISDAESCDTTLSFDILNSPFIINANVVNDISCFGFNDGEAISIGPNPLSNYGYQWGASAGNQATQSATNLSQGNHDVTITSAGGCSETVSVSIQEPTALTLAVTDVSICTNDLVTLSALASGATPTYTYAWENSLGQTQNPVGIVVTQSETYTVTATDANGCILSDDLTVTALETPVASFIVDENTSCSRPAFDFSFQNTSTPAGGTIAWDFGDNTTASGDFVSHSFVSPGMYTVTLNVTSPNGCTDTHIETDYITIFANPIADFTFTPEVASELNSNVQFIDLSTNDVDTWSWTFGSATSSTQNPSHDYAGSFGNQEVTLQVENAFGCIDSTSRYIEFAEDVLILAPNSFTPDGDEFNQTWRIHLVGFDLFDVEINIYNRWGQKVWQSFDVDVPWDGTFNGRIVPDGIYTWTLVVSDLNTDGKTERVGHISVLR